MINLRQFSGEIPRTPVDRLPPDAAQLARNCDLTAGELRPINGLGTHFTAGVSPVRGLFTDDGLRFYAWNKPTRAYLHPTIDDAYGRMIYHKHGDGLRVALVSGMKLANMSPAEPTTYWALGVTRPTSLAVSVGGAVQSGSAGVFARSTDGISWTASAESPIDGEVVIAAATVSGSDVVFGNSGSAARSADGATWTASASQPLSGGGVVAATAVSGGNILAVGANGLISISTDGGANWLIRGSGVTDDLNAATAAAGLWVVGGDSGKIITSPDSVTWTIQSSQFGVDSAVLGVEYLGAMFLAFGANGKLSTSTNGTSWTARTSAFGTESIRVCAYSGSKWVLAGDGGKITNSTNGITWIERSTPFSGSAVRRIDAGGGLVMALSVSGVLARSADSGDSWVKVAGVNTVHDVAYNAGLWVAATSSGVMTSADGVTWTARTTQTYGALAQSASGRIYAIASSSTATTETTTESVAVVAVAVNIWGEESAPTEPVLFDKETDQTATYTVTHTPTAGQQTITGIAFYRTYANAAGYFLINSTPVPLSGGTAKLTDASTEPVTTTALESSEWDLPPASPANLTYAGNGFYVVSSGKDLVFSEPYKPHAWPYRMTLPSAIVGITMAEGGILVTTTGLPYLISGAHPSQMSQTFLPAEQAGWSDTAIARVDGSAVYASNDGLVRVSGGQPSIAASQALFRRKDWRDRYGTARLNLRLAHHDGLLLGLVDPSYPAVATATPFLINLDAGSGALTRIDVGQPLYGASVSGATDQLFALTATGFAEFTGGTALTYEWWSGDKLHPSPVNYAAGVVDAVGSATLYVYADGTLRHTAAVSGRTAFRLPAGDPAYRWSVRLVGTAVVREVSLGASFAELKGV